VQSEDISTVSQYCMLPLAWHVCVQLLNRAGGNKREAKPETAVVKGSFFITYQNLTGRFW